MSKAKTVTITIAVSDLEILEKRKGWLMAFEPYDEAEPDEDSVEDGEKANEILGVIDRIQAAADGVSK